MAARLGHRGHVFCGQRICVPDWLDADFRRQAGELAADLDLAAVYQETDAALVHSRAPILDPLGDLRRVVARRLARTMAEASDREADRWADATDAWLRELEQVAAPPTPQDRAALGQALDRLRARLRRVQADRDAHGRA